MVSFHKHLSPTQRKTITELDNLTKKRKYREDPQVDEEVFHNPISKSIFDTELNLETPLPLEWQQCLNIKSGEIHYYNVRTQKRTSNDPRMSPELPSSPGGHMSLDLELNLPCGSPTTKNLIGDNFDKNNSGSSSYNSGEAFLNCSENKKKNSGGLNRCPSWLAFELGDQSQTEMITRVCNKCYMLVMMCKSSPACPNCKFMHPPDQSPPNLFKRRFSLLC
ncbi:hypothetical protein CsSME_00014316 [Camellia sinensis var. sinensis]|uniref:WW domain-containing protein n=1 Tax=Camellia sinensis TaxID=4442 RepID=A0A7J7HTF4_CAMSI|nr:hypothetical protein HYC85_008154 [Camellia sinensis]